MASMALAFDILARDKGASKTFDGVARSAENAGKKGVGFGGALKKGLGIAAGAFAAVGLVDLIGKATGAMSAAIGEAREAEKVGKTTAQIIKATGGASKISAAQVGALAEAISTKAGVDDEAIQSGANLLLTFKRVRNEAGKGNDVFNRATKAAVDLSATGFGSIEGSSKMLGKALQDPVRGLTALGRAGVTFTSQQKEQIKALVKTGDVLGAQKIILGEVESQVGGVAAANATMGEKVKVAWDNFLEKVGTKALPLLDRLGTWFIDKGLPAIEKFATWISEKAAPALGKLGDWIQEKILPRVESFATWVGDKLWPALKEGYETIMPGLRSALDILSGGVGDGEVSWRELGDTITNKVIPFIAKLTNVYLPYWAKQIRTVIDAVKIAWSVFETWRNIVMAVAGKINGAFTGIARVWASVLDALGNVPGFGWARDAAAKLRSAADQADDFGDAIRNIPSKKNVTVSVAYKSTGSARFDNNGVGYSAGKYKGGPVRKGVPYAVGENADGSWNKTTEIFIPDQNGRIANQQQIAAAVRGAPSGAPSSSAGQAIFRIPLVVDGKVLAEVVFDSAGQVLAGGLTSVGQS